MCNKPCEKEKTGMEEGKVSNGQASNGQDFRGKASDEQASGGEVSNEQDFSGQASGGKPSDEQDFRGEAPSGQDSGGEASDEKDSDGEASDEQISGGEASDGEPEPKNFRFFSHRECEFFPCHKVKNQEDFNCLFCYCPLYTLGDQCGGNFTYTEKGTKDCKNCLVPHSRNAFDHIMSRWKLLEEMGKRK